jgi:hypothetical protein
VAGIDNSWQEGKQSYRAFLLRCWQERDIENGGEPDQSLVWRFALVRLNDKSRKKGFACLADLQIFLNEEFKGTGKESSQNSR